MSAEQFLKRWDILEEVSHERDRQDTLFGPQLDLPDGTSDSHWCQEWRDIVRDHVEKEFAAGRGSHRLIMQEEYMEVGAEVEWPRLREELVQLAAVAVKWIEAGDARNG